MSLVKGKLKAARDALGKKQYAAAKDAAEQALAFDPENYNANVFIGLALLELGDFAQSEQAYRRAIDASPEQLLAWQGISKFYERTEQWDKYVETLRRLLDLFVQQNDALKCVETLEKLIDCRRGRGTHSQAGLVEALSLLLADSPLYAVLSTLPVPDHTNPSGTPAYQTQVLLHNTLPVLEEIARIIEKDEEDAYNKEVAKRRTRLGAASPEQLRKEVGMEIWGPSQLPKFYDDILNHPNTPDDLRRATDAKLLRYKLRYLCALPPKGDKKTAASREVENLVSGTITLGIPDELAWMLCLDGLDCIDGETYNLPLLRQFMELFPSLPLTSLLKAYFLYMDIPLVEVDDEDDTPSAPVEQTGDPFDTMLDAYPSVSDSVLATQIVAGVYLHECDYQNSLVVAENGLALVARAETDRGKLFPNTRLGFKVVLATSLVHLFPPKHHVRALSVLEEVLLVAPDNTACLMGRAYVLQHEKRWDDAAELFSRVSDLLPEDLELGIRAKEEHAWCQSQAGEVEVGIQGLEDTLAVLMELEDAKDDCARCLWRIGKSYWDMGDEKCEEAYRYFIQSLKSNPSYAPAFTSLGIYYAEFVTPRDPTRASKCFQKAFELDAREGDAARRLADGFADEREWDLVEVVARRTIEGEGGLDAGLKSDGAGRFLPNNAWAWKAVGVVELARGNYPLAIQALQITLRAEPDDQVSWLRLGEAYSRAGRHAAAIKALARAQELDPEDWMCAFFLADVQRQVGRFQEAVDAFQSILVHRPSEVGVLVSLGQTYLDLGRSEFTDGFAARAEQSFITSVQVALRTMQASPGFRGVSWKTAADAIFYLSRRSSFIDEDGVRAALLDVVALLSQGPGGQLAGTVSTPLFNEESPSTGYKALEVAAAAYDYRVTLGSSESVARGSAWYDLGMSLQSLSTKQPSAEKRQQAETKAGECLRAAIREDPGNDIYWVAFGNANFLSQVKTAQHAYIKALEIDSKNATTWTNLGLLYLHEKDLELANQALFRAQTLDPECTVAWVGQALVATANGHHSDSITLLEHAVTLASAIPEADLEFASRTFTRLTNATDAAAVDELLPAFLVLDRYCRGRPDDTCALHLFGLVCESLGQRELAVELIGRAIAKLEAEYEETEDSTVERQFTIANSNLARLRLALKDYEGAIESFESTLGLLAEDAKGDKTDVMRAQAQFGMGLANFKLGDLEAALGLFEAALQTAGDNPVIRGHVTVLIAQTMWGIGTEEFKESAKAHLLDCITADSENLAAINALAGMGILTDDEGLVDAALADLLALPLDRRLELDPQRDVNYLLTKHRIGQGNVEKALAVVQGAVFAEPSRWDVRNQLATLSIQQGNHSSALALLSASNRESDTLNTARASLALQAVTESLNGDVSHIAKKQAQKAVFLSPWDMRNWKALAYVGASL
ncbi:Antiviral protein [Mycena sanguinolenta]|uniref:Antiviral protein n=1 Tax=Mycena sanguinolenta TaxID=230812 RepID=A0A8H6ZEM1_9AGAR|nr:Antiviral protein [Mycena sanguinolenta]